MTDPGKGISKLQAIHKNGYAKNTEAHKSTLTLASVTDGVYDDFVETDNRNIAAMTDELRSAADAERSLDSRVIATVRSLENLRKSRTPSPNSDRQGIDEIVLASDIMDTLSERREANGKIYFIDEMKQERAAVEKVVLPLDIPIEETETKNAIDLLDNVIMGQDIEVESSTVAMVHTPNEDEGKIQEADEGFESQEIVLVEMDIISVVAHAVKEESAIIPIPIGEIKETIKIQQSEVDKSDEHSIVKNFTIKTDEILSIPISDPVNKNSNVTKEKLELPFVQPGPILQECNKDDKVLEIEDEKRKKTEKVEQHNVSEEIFAEENLNLPNVPDPILQEGNKDDNVENGQSKKTENDEEPNISGTTKISATIPTSDIEKVQLRFDSADEELSEKVNSQQFKERLTLLLGQNRFLEKPKIKPPKPEPIRQSDIIAPSQHRSRSIIPEVFRPLERPYIMLPPAPQLQPTDVTVRPKTAGALAAPPPPPIFDANVYNRSKSMAFEQTEKNSVSKPDEVVVLRKAVATENLADDHSDTDNLEQRMSSIRGKLENILRRGPPMRYSRPMSLVGDESVVVALPPAMTVTSTVSAATIENDALTVEKVGDEKSSPDNGVFRYEEAKRPFDTVHKQKALFNDVLKSIGSDARPSLLRTKSQASAKDVVPQ